MNMNTYDATKLQEINEFFKTSDSACQGIHQKCL